MAQLPATSDEERLDASAEQLLCRQLLGLCCLISSAILLPLSQPSLVNSPAVTSLFHHLLTSAQHMQAHAADPHAPNLPGILEELGLHTRLPRVHAQNRDTHTTRRPQLLLLPHQPEPASEALTAAAQLHALMAEVTNPSPDPSTIQAGKGRTDAELHHASIEDAHEQLMSTSSQLLDSMFHGYCTKLVDCYGGDMGDVASSVRLMLKSVFADITAFPLPPALPPATAKAFWGRYSNPMLTLASPAASLTGGLTPDADPSEETVPGQTTATLTATAARPTTARPTTASIQNSTGSNTQQGPALSADYVRVTAALGTLVSRLLPPKAVGASLLRPQMLSQLCDAYIQLCAGLGATCRMRNGRMLASQMSRSRTTRASNSSVVGLIGLTGSAGYDRRSAVTDARTVGPASAPCDSSKAGFGAAPGTGMSRLAASSPVPGTSGSSGEQGADSSDHRLPNLPQTWAYMAQLECKDAMEFGLEEYGDRWEAEVKSTHLFVIFMPWTFMLICISRSYWVVLRCNSKHDGCDARGADEWQHACAWQLHAPLVWKDAGDAGWVVHMRAANTLLLTSTSPTSPALLLPHLHAACASHYTPVTTNGGCMRHTSAHGAR